MTHSFKSIIALAIIALCISACGAGQETQSTSIQTTTAKSSQQDSGEQKNCRSKAKLPNGESNFVMVLCPEQITPELVKQIKIRLRALDYPITDAELNNPAFGSDSRAALMNFQLSAELPSGQMHREIIAAETLNALGITNF